MLRSYVCRQCRTQLRQRVTTPRTPQWQPRATFISLRNGNLQPEDNTNVDGQEPRAPTYQDHPPPIERAPSGRYSRNEGVPSAKVDEVDSEAAAETSASPAQALNDLLDKKSIVSTISAWNLFLQAFPSRDAPAFTTPSYNDVPLLTGGKVFTRLARAMAMGSCNGKDMPAAPTEVLFRFEQMGIAPYPIWRFAIGDLTDQLLWGVCGTAHGKKSPEDILDELVSVWRLFFQCKGQETDNLESISSEWKNIPDVSAETGRFHDTRFGVRMTAYHPKSPSGVPLQFSAITLFNLFDEVNQEVFKVPQELREHAAPFIRLITYLLSQSNVDNALRHVDYSASFQALPEDFRTSVLDQIRSAPFQAMRVTATQQPNRRHKEARSTSKSTAGANVDANSTSTDATEAKEPQEPLSLEDMFRKRIERAVVSQAHAGVLDKLWREAQAVFKKTDDGKITPLVYNSFLSGFMTLYQSEKAVEVWNHMIGAGIKPEMRTWVAMLHGCSKARDLDGLKAVWDRMIMSGAEPDGYAWTVRIYGLISQRQITLAMNAMDEMGKRYLEAANPTKASQQTLKSGRKLPTKPIATSPARSPVRPSIETINAAISALVDIPFPALALDQKVKYVQKILKWGGQFGIRPDAYTYNHLIKLYSRVNDTTTTFKLLRQMEAEGIEGDTSTYTMLINTAFNNQKFDNLSPSEQQDLVLNLFDQLEAGGIKLNEYVYSGAIDRLLKLYGNVPAVIAIMKRMSANNINTSAPIYTSLITHCFQQQPPDIASVDAIVNRIFSPPKAQTDKFLFDRIIEGYATHGEVDSMMKVLTKMNSHGKLPAFSSLTAALQALAEVGDWERARKIVRDVQRSEGVAKGGPTGGAQAAKRFMNVAQSFGVGLEEPFAGEALRKEPVQDGRVESRDQEFVRADES